MDQKKVGGLLKALRRENNLTQEKLAERLGVSARTVSRWETGTNLPDLDALLELADLYCVDIRELLDGERKNENMDKETRETMKKVAEYSGEEKKRLAKRMQLCFIAGVAAFGLYAALDLCGVADAGVWAKAADCALGFVLGSLIIGVLFTSGVLDRMRQAKLRLLRRAGNRSVD